MYKREGGLASQVLPLQKRGKYRKSFRHTEVCVGGGGRNVFIPFKEEGGGVIQSINY